MELSPDFSDKIQKVASLIFDGSPPTDWNHILLIVTLCYNILRSSSLIIVLSQSSFLITMENHVFADAIPYPEHAPEQPCWKVFVHRKGVSEPVGCLHVHPSNLPPRKKKNKILWKLPGSLDENPPRFGGHEKERLWEMFKQQKKERRKSKKSVAIHEAEDVQKVAAELEATLLNGQKEDSPTAAALSAAPPPGFAQDHEEPANMRTTSSGEEPPNINKNISANQEAHLKNGNTQQQSPNKASDPIQHSGLPPPPPGLSLQQQQEQQPVAAVDSPKSSFSKNLYSPLIFFGIISYEQ